MHAHQIQFLELLNGQVQYVVPRWQRRYRWGQREIERLIEDLLTVSAAGGRDECWPRYEDLCAEGRDLSQQPDRDDTTGG